MKITDLKPRIVAVYAGRFQPFHHGHAQVYQELANKFGINNTYITTGNKVEPIKSPFTFAEKLVMIQAAGVSSSNVSEEIVPYAPVNLPQALGLDPNKDVMVFGVGAKDMAEDPRFAFTPLKDGTPSYFQQWTGKDLKPFTNAKGKDGQRAGHGYVIPVNDVKFKIMGQSMNSASAIRELYKNSNNEQRLQILTELYPDAGGQLKQIKRIFDAKLGK